MIWFIPVMILMGTLGSFYLAFLLTHLWGWYVTPVFHVAVPSLIALIGLSMTVKFFLYMPMQERKKTKLEIFTTALASMLAHTVFFGIAWALHYFV
jgi:heme/copper-type cytochrome/quinol oxidase subunit 4